MRSKYLKDDDYGGYAINVGFYDIIGILGRPSIMKYGNDLLQAIGLQKCSSENDTIDKEFKDGKIQQ